MILNSTKIRRSIVILAGLLLCCSTFAETAFRVTLLGTGDPIPRLDRFGPATLVQVGGQNLLFDAGRGVAQRIYQLGLPLRDINAVFLTHLHSDHLTGLPDLWMTGWLPPPFGRRSVPFEVWGPTGTSNLLSHLQQAFVANTNIRIKDELLPPEGIKLVAHEFDNEGVVFEKDGIVVTAITVNHGELIKPAYGYRVDYKGHSVVISGDTKYNENLIRAAKGTDLLIHEVVLVSKKLATSSEQFARIVAHHTPPEDAGRVFTQVAPKLAVYTHLVLLSAPGIPEEPLSSLVARTRTTYDGPLVVGEDLMSFVIGDTITIYRPAR